ncbi:MAG TPA: pyridoxamine 5'-phosphate oxidase family protein [Thermomicrobiales bacterium]|nr:pyridoxamine 5'-phosphate oxidase family protein [Thermomicrobiales bacterium]
MTTTERNDQERLAGDWLRDRPRMPGYGIPESTDGMLSWTEVAERLASAPNYWISTATPDGMPHAVPVWGAFLDDTLYFDVGPRSKRNLLANPRVSVHLESAQQVVIVEGVVDHMHDPDPALSQAIDDQYGEKYDWRPSGEEGERAGEGWFSLTPDRVIAWTSFPADATRWTRRRTG